MKTTRLQPKVQLRWLIGILPVMLLLTSAPTTFAQQNVTWTPDPLTGFTISGNSITKTGATGWGGGPNSSQTVTSGDGYVEFTATETDTTRICGIANSTGSINFGVFMYGGSLWVAEGGNYPYTSGTVTAGDRYRVAVESGVIKYYKNGTLFYTSSGTPVYPFFAMTSFYTTGATITNAVIGSGGSNSSPTVSLTAPANNSTFDAGSNITLTATASDSDGTISKVEFYQGSTKLGEDTSSPYSYTWTNVAAGSYSLTAKATDNGNATTTSSAVSITVNASSQLWSSTTGGIYTSAGNVGIGTSSPTAKLHVLGDVIVSGNIAAKYQDLAEWVPCLEQLPAGTVLILDPSKSNYVMASTQAYDTRVAGVISDRPGIALGEGGTGKVLVATTGRVRVKVDASKGAIHIGDLLVTSDIPGIAMKSQPISVGGVLIHRPGTLIGKALEPLANGKGEILVLLSLQ